MMIRLDLSDPFQRELQDLREVLLRMAGQVEAQIERALTALRELDGETAEAVQQDDRLLNEAYRQLRERCFSLISTQRVAHAALSELTANFANSVAVPLNRMSETCDIAIAIRSRLGSLNQNVP